MWIGFLGVLVFLLVADYITEEDEAERKIKNPWIADFALYLHFPLMILLFGSFAWRIQQGFSEPTAFMTVLAYAGCIFSAAFLGNAPNLPIAHELFHRRHWFPRYLGTTLNVYFGDPVKDIQHVYNHHIHVGTLKDPDTPRRGESVYKFIFRATWHSYKESYKIEKERQRKKRSLGLVMAQPYHPNVCAIRSVDRQLLLCFWVAGCTACNDSFGCSKAACRSFQLYTTLRTYQGGGHTVSPPSHVGTAHIFFPGIRCGNHDTCTPSY